MNNDMRSINSTIKNKAESLHGQVMGLGGHKCELVATFDMIRVYANKIQVRNSDPTESTTNSTQW